MILNDEILTHYLCSAIRYNRKKKPMILKFAHKGLERFFATGSKAGINPQHADRLSRQLAFLDEAVKPKDVDVPGWKLHVLLGDLADYHSISVNGNWRLIFKFIGKNVEIVDYLDYH